MMLELKCLDSWRKARIQTSPAAILSIAGVALRGILRLPRVAGFLLGSVPGGSWNMLPLSQRW